MASARRTDSEDPAKGYGPHSDQERILESELHRFVRFEWDIVQQLAQGSLKMALGRHFVAPGS